MQVSVCACRHLYIVIHLSGLRAESYYFFYFRDNPSERLGNLKNGVKDIQKHK